MSKMMVRAGGRRPWVRMCAAASAVMIAGASTVAPVIAQSATTPFVVTADVLSVCDLKVTTPGLAFGSYDPVVVNAASHLDKDGTILVTCTLGTQASVSMGLGLNPTGSTRRMTSGAALLTYELYRDSARTQIWGTTEGTDRATLTGTGEQEELDVYGRVFMSQIVPKGDYEDTVVVTVSY